MKTIETTNRRDTKIIKIVALRHMSYTCTFKKITRPCDAILQRYSFGPFPPRYHHESLVRRRIMGDTLSLRFLLHDYLTPLNLLPPRLYRH